MKVLLVTVFTLVCLYAPAQMNTANKDTTINNLVLTPGYKTSERGAIPQFVKKGNGKQAMILIPGLGFDASVFSDFMDANKKNYTMYAITIPGYGNTSAPPMPDSTISYGEQSWNKSVLEGLKKLIVKEKLKKPVIVGHFIHGVQVAVQFAAQNPELCSGLILAGGAAKFTGIQNGKLIDDPADKMAQNTDKFMAPVWFKHMKKTFFDNGNFKPGFYSFDKTAGQSLWNQVAAVSFPVMVRYCCEYFASDVTPGFEKIKCPVLVLRSAFNEETWKDPANTAYFKPQFVDSWDKVSSQFPFVKVVDVKDAAAFVWKGKPEVVFKEIKSFVSSLTK